MRAAAVRANCSNEPKSRAVSRQLSAFSAIGPGTDPFILSCDPNAAVADVTAHYARHLLCARSEASQNKVLSSHARGRKYLMTITTTTTTGVGAGVLISLFISDMEAMRKQRNQRVRSDEVAAG